MERMTRHTLAFLDETGSRILEMLSFAGFTIVLIFEGFFHSRYAWQKRHEIMKQMYIAGVKSFLVVSIVAFFTGMILSLQAGIEMKAFNQQALVGNLMITTLTREMSPFVSAVVLIATVGSGIAAEIATMKVSEEIDALEMMSISPSKFLVMPRLIALLLMFPIVSIYFTVLGALGGGVVAFFQLEVSWDVYYRHVLESLHFKATYVGLLKSCIFGIMVAGICCAKGLLAVDGAMGVGKATRSSVIGSLLMVLIIGYYVTAMFYGGGG